MNVGFRISIDERGALVERWGESPLLGEARDATRRVIFLGRLYYLADLRRRLSESFRAERHPGRLALGLYHRYGPEGLSHLEGDYALAIWDERQRRLIALRDPWGGFPLFWTESTAGVAVSTSPRALRTTGVAAEIDPEYLADFLVVPGLGLQELDQERCAYLGIRRIRAGTRLEVDFGLRTRTVRWWNWEERLEEPASLRVRAISERYGELLDAAVRERSLGRTAAHLSGGMDSTSVALLAARHARRHQGTVDGISLVYDTFPILARETPYIECASAEPGLLGHRVPGESYCDFGGYRGSAAPEEPMLSVWQAPAAQALVDCAADLGASTLLTGMVADEFVALLPYHLSDWLRRGRWRAAWREAARWGKARGFNRWRYLTPFGITPLVPAPLRSGLGAWLRRGRVRWERQGALSVAPWIDSRFALRHHLWERMVEQQRRTFARGRPIALSIALEKIHLNMGDSVRWELGLPRGVFVAHPFRDPRLVRFCLGWQGKVAIDPGRQKPILAEAMRDVLPEAIRQRARKGHFNESFFHGLARHLPVLETIIRDAPVDDLQFVDKEEMLRCLRKAALGVGDREARGADRLSLTLCLLHWLRQQRTGEVPARYEPRRTA